MEREDEFELMNRLATFAGIAGPESQEERNFDALWQRRVLRGALNLIEAMSESPRSPDCSTATDADIIKGLKHNLKVIESELRQIDEREVSKKAWDHIFLAIEFAEEE